MIRVALALGSDNAHSGACAIATSFLKVDTKCAFDRSKHQFLPHNSYKKERQLLAAAARAHADNGAGREHPIRVERLRHRVERQSEHWRAGLREFEASAVGFG